MESQAVATHMRTARGPKSVFGLFIDSRNAPRASDSGQTGLATKQKKALVTARRLRWWSTQHWQAMEPALEVTMAVARVA